MQQDNKKLLTRLSLKIDELSEQALHYDNVELQGACFDDLLFKPCAIKRTGYEQYINEIKSNYQKLQQLFDNENNVQTHAEQINYLTEKLLNQISALSRQFVTQKTNKHKIASNELNLFEKHAQYLGYLRKLEWIKEELNKNRVEQHKIQQINERIIRCQTAIKQVEEQIELFEQTC